MKTLKNEITYKKINNNITIDIGNNEILTFDIWSEFDVLGDDFGFEFDEKSLKIFNSYDEKKQDEIMDYIHNIKL